MMLNQYLDHSNAVLRVCIDDILDGRLRGRVYGQRLTQPILFTDMGNLLLQVEAVLDAQNFPQAFQRIRTFTSREISYPASVLPEGGMSSEEVAAVSGEKATFHLSILTRRNTTWQGVLDWLDGSTESFSSDLELLKLVDHRLSTL